MRKISTKNKSFKIDQPSRFRVKLCCFEGMMSLLPIGIMLNEVMQALDVSSVKNIKTHLTIYHFIKVPFI